MNSLPPVTSTFTLIILLILNIINKFLSLVDHADLTQHVSFPTHRHSHTLFDLVITSANSTIPPMVSSLPISPTDQFPIICSLKITNSPILLL